MSSILNPYLTFDGKAREAMEFYQSVFGGELQVSTAAEIGMGDSDAVAHAQLQTPSGYTLMASDLVMGDYVAPAGFTITISGDDKDELTGYFNALAEGARVDLPLSPQPWGDEFGQLVDKFGIAWGVNISAPA